MVKSVLLRLGMNQSLVLEDLFVLVIKQVVLNLNLIARGPNDEFEFLNEIVECA